MKEYRSITLWMDYFMDEFFPSITQEESDMIEAILHWTDDQKAAFMMSKGLFEQRNEDMDKKIKKLQKDTKKIVKEESALLKADKKRDKFVDAGKKALKK